jgi:hypothetical protein
MRRYVADDLEIPRSIALVLRMMVVDQVGAEDLAGD